MSNKEAGQNSLAFGSSIMANFIVNPPRSIFQILHRRRASKFTIIELSNLMRFVKEGTLCRRILSAHQSEARCGTSFAALTTLSPRTGKFLCCAPHRIAELLIIISRRSLLSPEIRVSSAFRAFTSVFEMGTGGSHETKSPGNYYQQFWCGFNF